MRVTAACLLALCFLMNPSVGAAGEPEIDGESAGPRFHIKGAETKANSERAWPKTRGATRRPRERITFVRGCQLGGRSVCDTARACDGSGVLYQAFAVRADGRMEYRGTVCRGGDSVPGSDVAAPVEVTSAMVLRALRRVGVPEPVLVVSPPGGRTLVNLETIFSTEVEPFTASVRLVGRRVDVRVEPVGFVWSHGDGTSQRSDFAGRSYAEGVAWSEYLTHAYSVAGVVRAGVSVEYAARFRVDGGRWREVEGTVRVAGEPVELRVVEARPELVSAR